MAKDNQFSYPTPNPLVMRLCGVISEWLLLRGVPGLRELPLLRDLPGFGGYFKISRIVLSDEDQQIIREATNPKNAFFIGPNHPEYTTDWLIDKYISDRYAPQISCWANASIISGPLKPFWLANNIIANNGGEAAKEYSIQCALAGKGTLLHPEGTVRWRGDKVFEPLPGIIDMSLEAARRLKEQGSDRAVYVLPLVWKVFYDQDISAALNKELARLEARLNLPNSAGASAGERYRKLQQNLLWQQMDRFGYSADYPEAIGPEQARSFFHSLLQELIAKYAIEQREEIHHRTIHRIYRAVREKPDSLDLAKVEELQRLASYSPETFEKGFFYQDEVAEGLQFVRQIFLAKGYDSLRSFLPKPFGWRTLVIRAVQPLNISQALHESAIDSSLPARLLQQLHQSMNSKLAELLDANRERLRQC